LYRENTELRNEERVLAGALRTKSQGKLEIKNGHLWRHSNDGRGLERNRGSRKKVPRGSDALGKPHKKLPKSKGIAVKLT